MRTVQLGSQGLAVSAQGLGCMGMSQSYGPTDEKQSIATLHRALDLVVTLFDTANVYGVAGGNGFGANEELIGRARFQLAADPSYVRSACEASLRRLGTDHIDLYYSTG